MVHVGAKVDYRPELSADAGPGARCVSGRGPARVLRSRSEQQPRLCMPAGVEGGPKPRCAVHSPVAGCRPYLKESWLPRS